MCVCQVAVVVAVESKLVQCLVSGCLVVEVAGGGVDRSVELEEVPVELLEVDR